MWRWLKLLFTPARRIPVTVVKRSAVAVALSIATISTFEGLRTKAYLDVAGVPTICVGETRGVKLGQTKTVDECKEILAQTLKEFDAHIYRCIPSAHTLPDTTWIAIRSWTYNVGVGAMCRSTLVKKLNAGDIEGACRELPKWVRAGGRVIRGLEIRRQAEMKLCLEQRWL
jgi:lysozyme